MIKRLVDSPRHTKSMCTMKTSTFVLKHRILDLNAQIILTCIFVYLWSHKAIKSHSPLWLKMDPDKIPSKSSPKRFSKYFRTLESAIILKWPFKVHSFYHITLPNNMFCHIRSMVAKPMTDILFFQYDF